MHLKAPLFIGTLLVMAGCTSVTTPSASTAAHPNPASAAAAPAAPNLAQQIIGAWILVGHPNGRTIQGSGTRLKLFTERHWIITDPNPTTHQVRFHHGGTYTVTGDELVSSVEFANANTANQIGRTRRFKIKIEGDSLTQAGDDGLFNEVWRRLK